MTYLDRIKQTVQESLRMGDHELATDLRLLLAVVEAMEPVLRAANDEDSAINDPKVSDSFNPDYSIDVSLTVSEIQAMHRALAALKKEAE